MKDEQSLKIENKFVEIRFVGLRRSGTHAVQNWIVSLFDGPVCYLNDVTGKKKIHSCQASDDLPAVRKEGKSVRLNDPKSLLLYSIEDRRLQFLSNYRFPYPEEQAPIRVIDVILLRDPYNTIASRLKIGRDRSKNGLFSDMLMRDTSGRAFFPQLWKNYAYEFIGHFNHLQNEKVCINFNRWKSEKSYREQICRQLEVRVASSEDVVREVPGWGFGSSFDSTKFDGKAERMDLDNRWQAFENDKEFYELVDDEEMGVLSKRIFGIGKPNLLV